MEVTYNDISRTEIIYQFGSSAQTPLCIYTGLPGNRNIKQHKENKRNIFGKGIQDNNNKNTMTDSLSPNLNPGITIK